MESLEKTLKYYPLVMRYDDLNNYKIRSKLFLDDEKNWLEKYPKITGSIDVIHANVFYIKKDLESK